MLHALTLAFADAPAPAGPDGTSMLLYGVGLFLIFYFMLIRPQKREAAKRDAMVNSLKKHDWVVTHAGMIGQVVDVQADIVTLKVDDNHDVRVRFKKVAIAGMLETTSGKPAEGKKGSDDGKSTTAPETRAVGRGSR